MNSLYRKLGDFSFLLVLEGVDYVPQAFQTIFRHPHVLWWVLPTASCAGANHDHVDVCIHHDISKHLDLDAYAGIIGERCRHSPVGAVDEVKLIFASNQNKGVLWDDENSSHSSLRGPAHCAGPLGFSNLAPGH